MEKQKELRITKEELIPYIERKGRELYHEIAQAKEQLGPRYNYKNKFEIMFQKFGDPRLNAVAFADEFYRIMNKSSQLPASIRYPVRDICQAAMTQCYHDKVAQLYRQEKEEKENKEVQ